MDSNCTVTPKPKSAKEFFKSWYFWKAFLGIAKHSFDIRKTSQSLANLKRINVVSDFPWANVMNEK